MEYDIICPCCGNKYKIQLKDDGEISIIFFIEDTNKLQEKLSEKGIEFGTQKGVK